MPHAAKRQKTAYGHHYRKQREAVLAEATACWSCGAVPTETDHQPPLALHDHVEGTGCCELLPSCHSCARKQGGLLARVGTRRPKEVIEEPAASPGISDSCWQVSWLTDLIDSMPSEATWPRYMTLPHPDAVGSYGEEVEDVASKLGYELRWWQRLWWRRQLEHDEDGQLLWFTIVGPSVARQLGKSWGLRAGCLWRIGQQHRFGIEQDVVHAARRLELANAIQRPARVWAESKGWYVRHANGQEMIGHPNGGAWMLKSIEGIVGTSAAMGCLDEAWDIASAVVDDSLEPTTVERPSGQIILISTAHRLAKGLMLNRRHQALQEIDAPDDTLILEWSTPRSYELDDVEGWRMASPHWSARREKLMRRALERAQSGESLDDSEPDPIESFKAMWLNQWPLKRAVTKRSDSVPLIDLTHWRTLETQLTHHRFTNVVIAVEDNHGLGLGAIAAGMTDDGVVVVSPSTFEDRDEGIDWLSQHADARTVVAGVSLTLDPDFRDVVPHAVPSGTTETAQMLPVIRQLAWQSKLLHVKTDEDELDRQIESFLVRVTPSQQLTIASKERSDLVRCVGWSIRQLYREAGMDPTIT